MAVLIGAVVVRSPRLLLLPVLPAMYMHWRVGGPSLNLSVADLVLLVGSAAALPFAAIHSPRLRRCMAGIAAYQAILGLALLSHPTRRAVIEWNHRILLTAGAVAVGVALARLGRTGLAIGIFLISSAVVAVAACLDSAASGFGPAYPLGFQKNSAGLLLAFAFLATVVAPQLSAVPPALVAPLRGVLLLGVLATQSRGSMLATIAGVAIHLVLKPDAIRRVPTVLTAVLAMGFVIVTVNARQAERIRVNPDAARFFGAGARKGVNEQAIGTWAGDPLLGAGLRYFNDPAENTSEPHNVVVVSLAESGVVGLVALVVLFGMTWSSLRGLPGELATLAGVVMGVRLLAAVFDIYWVAGRGSLPWVLVGMAFGAEAYRGSDHLQHTASA